MKNQPDAGDPKKPAKSSAKSANANASTKATASVKVTKKGGTKKSPPTRQAKSAPVAPTTTKAKSGNVPIKAFARGNVTTTAPKKPSAFARMGLKVSAVPSPQNRIASPKKSPSVAQSNLIRPQDELIPFAGWPPVKSASDIERLQKAINQFSEDHSFED